MARKSRKQTAAPMPAPSLYVHVALYIRLSVEDNKKRGCSVENQKLVLNDFLSDKPDFVVYDTYIDNGATGTNFHRPGFQQMLQLSVSLCQIKNRVIICSAVRYSVDAAIMQCLYEMVRGFIAVIPRWLKRFLVMVCA